MYTSNKIQAKNIIFKDDVYNEINKYDYLNCITDWYVQIAQCSQYSNKKMYTMIKFSTSWIPSPLEIKLWEWCFHQIFGYVFHWWKRLLLIFFSCYGKKLPFFLSLRWNYSSSFLILGNTASFGLSMSILTPKIEIIFDTKN